MTYLQPQSRFNEQLAISAQQHAEMIYFWNDTNFFRNLYCAFVENGGDHYIHLWCSYNMHEGVDVGLCCTIGLLGTIFGSLWGKSGMPLLV